MLRIKKTKKRDETESDGDQTLDAFEITVKKNTSDPRVKEVVARHGTDISKISPISNDFGVPEESVESSKISPSEMNHRNKLRKVGSYLDINYDSPNIHDIRKQQRLYDLEDINRRVDKKGVNSVNNKILDVQVISKSSEN